MLDAIRKKAGSKSHGEKTHKHVTMCMEERLKTPEVSSGGLWATGHADPSLLCFPGFSKLRIYCCCDGNKFKIWGLYIKKCLSKFNQIFFLPFTHSINVYYMDWYSYIDLFLHSWDKSYLFMVYNLFICFRFSLLVFCWEVFHLYSYKVYWILYFFCGVFFWPWYQRNAGLIKWVRKNSLLFY